MCFTILMMGEGFVVVLRYPKRSTGGDGIGDGPPFREVDRDVVELLRDDDREEPLQMDEMEPLRVTRGRLLDCDLERLLLCRFRLVMGSGRRLLALLMANSDEHRRSSGLDRQLRSLSEMISPRSSRWVFFTRPAISTISQMFSMRASSIILTRCVYTRCLIRWPDIVVWFVLLLGFVLEAMRVSERQLLLQHLCLGDVLCLEYMLCVELYSLR